jgi:hypothetical protein
LTILPPTVPFSVLVALALGLLYELLNAEVAVPPLLAAVPANRGHGRPGTVIVVCILVLLSSEALALSLALAPAPFCVVAVCA